MKISVRAAWVAALLSLSLASNGWSNQVTVTWPMVIPPGSNTATVPAPRIDWVNRFSANVVEVTKMPKVDLVFDGDSITDWWRTGGKPIWDQKYVPLNAADYGISGDRTEHLLWRLDNGQLTPNVQPKLVFLMIGTNNLGANAPDQIAAGVKAIVTEYRTKLPNATVVLQAIFPRGKDPTDPARAKIKAVNVQLATMAGDHILYLDFGDKFLQPDGSISKDIMGDFLHPTIKGYQIWADAIQPTIDQFFPPAK